MVSEELNDYNKIFLELIGNYNKKKDFRTHLVVIAKDEIMMIEWDGVWTYSLHKFEELKNE